MLDGEGHEDTRLATHPPPLTRGSCRPVTKNAPAFSRGGRFSATFTPTCLRTELVAGSLSAMFRDAAVEDDRCLLTSRCCTVKNEA